MLTTPTSLFDTPETWRYNPLEAFGAWLLDPSFVVTKQGVEQPLRDSSVVVYRAMGSKFIRDVVLPEEGVRPGKTWGDIEADDIRAFFARHELKKGIRNRYVKLLERLFDHLVRIELAGHNPVRGLAIREPSRSGQGNAPTMWLTGEQQAAVLAALPDADGWKSQRNRALIAVMLGAGLKPSEAIRLHLRDIESTQTDGATYLNLPPTGAGRAHRTKLAPAFVQILDAWLEQRAAYELPGELVFPASPLGGVLHPATVYRHVARTLTDAGIDPAIVKRRGARTLRNSFALKELAGGQTIEAVGEFLGHRTERATFAYRSLLKTPAL